MNNCQSTYPYSSSHPEYNNARYLPAKTLRDYYWYTNREHLLSPDGCIQLIRLEIDVLTAIKSILSFFPIPRPTRGPHKCVLALMRTGIMAIVQGGTTKHSSLRVTASLLQILLLSVRPVLWLEDPLTLSTLYAPAAVCLFNFVATLILCDWIRIVELQPNF